MPRQAIPGGTGVAQFLRFGIVGVIGFAVDAGLLHVLLDFGLGYYGGRLLSFLAAASVTWILNRSFTFGRKSASATRPAPHHLAGEWMVYLGLMVIGGAVNYGVYAAAVTISELVRGYPALGVAFGSIAGMGINFWSAKTLVFERKARP